MFIQLSPLIALTYKILQFAIKIETNQNIIYNSINIQRGFMEFDDIIKRLRAVLSNSNSMQKIYDKDIALALELDAQYFAVMKKRKKIPFKEIAIFCNKNNLNINQILFKLN